MNISFNKTIPQMIAYAKLTTRRLGWWNLKPGQVLQAIEKGQGLKKGEKIVPIHPIQIISVSQEPLNLIVQLPKYGALEMVREGFPGMDPAEFVDFFCKMNKCEPDTIVNRIDFRHYIATDKPTELVVPGSIAVCPGCGKGLIVSPNSWYMDDNGTLSCGGYIQWCTTDPNMRNSFGGSRYPQFQSLIDWYPTQAAVDTWLMDTFRFEL